MNPTPTTSPSGPGHPGMAAWPRVPLLGTGPVRHTRLQPTHHAFAYPACFLWLPMRTLATRPDLLQQAGLNGLLLSFAAADHGNGAADLRALVRWMTHLLHQHGVTDADGELWLQCFPRTLGHAFKPVSFWHALRADGSLRATVAEVNNTFGERHFYVLDGARWGRTHWVDKAFHVSPFCEVRGQYAFRFLCTTHAQQHRSVVRIDHTEGAATVLQTSISGHLQPATPALLRHAFWTHPLQSWGVTLRIHWQALRLWFKGVPVHRKPTPPSHCVSVAPLDSHNSTSAST